MPFKSFAQQRFLFAKHPKIAKRWAEKYGTKKRPPGYRPGPREAVKRKLKGGK